MKKTIFVLAALLAVAITFTSFKSESAAPKLYPELEAYLKSVETKEFNKEHLGTLDNLKYVIDAGYNRGMPESPHQVLRSLTTPKLPA